jgi:hypothetical protein
MPISTGTELVEEVFGGVIDDDSAGFYTALELFGILGGTITSGKPLLPNEGCVETKLNGADFARRYAWTPQDPKDRQLRITGGELEIFEGHLRDINAVEHQPLRGLVAALAAPRRPGTRNPRTWTGSHLMPYSVELAHWDVAGRAETRGASENTRIVTERYYLRGAGALIHKIIRKDKNEARLSAVREKLTETLQPNSISDRLFGILNTKNRSGSENPSVDQIEDRARRDEGCPKGEECLRAAVSNILSHDNLDKYIRIDSLLYLLPLTVMCLLLRKADVINEAGKLFVSGVVDFGTRPSQLRRVSKASLSSAQKRIERALKVSGENLLAGSSSDIRSGITKAAVSGVKGYYPRSAAAIGYLNSFTGIRHHVLKDPLINALVMAEIGADEEEITLDEFCNRLFEHWGMVINRQSAQKAGLLKEMNGAVFDGNTNEYFASSLRRLGVLREFSDQTRMVGVSK